MNFFNIREILQKITSVQFLIKRVSPKVGILRIKKNRKK